MKKALLVTIIVLVAIVLGWHAFEFFWDRKLFATDETNMSVTNVGSREARELLLADPSIQVLDVRPQRSYRQGHLPGATNVTYRKGEIDSAALAGLDPQRPVLIYCDGGFRSRLSLASFEEAGFETIYHLHRGILSWKLQGGKVETDSSQDLGR